MCKPLALSVSSVPVKGHNLGPLVGAKQSRGEWWMGGEGPMVRMIRQKHQGNSSRRLCFCGMEAEYEIPNTGYLYCEIHAQETNQRYEMWLEWKEMGAM